MPTLTVTTNETGFAAVDLIGFLQTAFLGGYADGDATFFTFTDGAEGVEARIEGTGIVYDTSDPTNLDPPPTAGTVTAVRITVTPLAGTPTEVGLISGLNVDALVFYDAIVALASGNEVPITTIIAAYNWDFTGGSSNDTFEGGPLADILRGGGGDDTLMGADGSDRIIGGAGADTIVGGEDIGDGDNDIADYTAVTNDLLIDLAALTNQAKMLSASGAPISGETDQLIGIESVYGGSGDDEINGDAQANTLLGGAGVDYLQGRGGNDILNGGSGFDYAVFEDATASLRINLLTDRASGSGIGTDTLVGIEGAIGGRGDDVLTGDSGTNILAGGAGNDRLIGGRGRDAMFGDAGRDIFEFNAINETGKTRTTADVILEFRRGYDDIDLYSIDANTRIGGNQKFTWIGTQGFHKKAGELHYKKFSTDGVLVEGDVNGDGRADFAIAVEATALAATDFLL